MEEWNDAIVSRPSEERGLGAAVPASSRSLAAGTSGRTSAHTGARPPGRLVEAAERLPVLVVEDAELVRGALARVLERAGYEPVAADDGERALELIRARAFAAAIVDQRPPGPDGLSLLAELQERQPHAVRVLVSGALDLDTAIAAVNEGHVDHVFEKPLRVEELLSRLATSLERARKLREGHPWQPSLQEVEQRTQLSECLDGGLLDLALQPIVDPRTECARAYEALLRSSHERLRNPGEVIAAAERSGRMWEVTRLVAKRAVRWCERLPDDVLLFLNLHPSDLEQPELLLSSLSVLRSHSHRVVLEVTERSALGKGWQECLPRLRREGFRIAVDDAGAGYSSLSTIAEAEPEVIKVDMSIVRDIDRRPPRRLLLQMLAAFARESGVQLIAEGVETQAEADCIRESGDVWVQGYFYGRPTLWSDWAQ